MTCEDVERVAAELALGVLDGAERGDALVHLEHCAGCRHEVARTTEATESLLLLTPAAAPPAGFEARVLAALPAAIDCTGRDTRPDAPRSRASVRWLAAIAAAVVLAACTTMFSPTESPQPASRAFASTVLRTADGAQVGTGYLHRGSPGWAFVHIPHWRAQLAARDETDRAYTVRVVDDDGAAYVTGSLIQRDGTWASSLHIDVRSVRSIAVVDDQGSVWCTGRFRA